MCCMCECYKGWHRDDGWDLASTLCKYDLRNGVFIYSELGKGATSVAGKYLYLFRAGNVWWRCTQHFVIASCGLDVQRQ